MNNNLASAPQLLELSALQTKRLEGVADREEVKKAIAHKDHPFWEKFSLAIQTLVVVGEETGKSVLRKIKDTAVGAISGKKTVECFMNQERYFSRDPYLDIWIPDVQVEEPAGVFSVQELEQGASLKEIAEEILGERDSIKRLSKLLIERKITTVLPRIESLIERQESFIRKEKESEDVGLKTDSCANFFFIVDKEGYVSVVRVFRHDGQWRVSISRLNLGRLWYVSCRVFVRN